MTREYRTTVVFVNRAAVGRRAGLLPKQFHTRPHEVCHELAGRLSDARANGVKKPMPMKVVVAKIRRRAKGA
jgi:hypothetical protein